MARAFAAHFVALVGTLACAALACPVGTSAPRPIPVLMYHHVGDWGPSNPGWADWVVKPSAFAAQLDWLRDHGYQTITFRELFAALDHGLPLPAKPVIITFDDGWDEGDHWFRTELEPRGMKGVLFVFTGAVAAKRNGGGYISWEQLHELEAHGHEVQSHTVGHPSLRGLPPSALARELAESRRTIERETGHAADVIAYPFGHFDARVTRAASAAGYRLGVRAEADPSVAPAAAFAFPRLRVGYDDPIEVFAERIESGRTPRSLH